MLLRFCKKLLKFALSSMPLLIMMTAIFAIPGCDSAGPAPPVPAMGNAPLGLHEKSSFAVLDVLILIDQSGSMSAGEDVTDPLNKRITATEHLVNSLMLKSDQDNPHRIGVISFGTSVPEEQVIALTPVADARDADALAKKLAPLDLGWTNFGEALKRAATGFADAKTVAEGRKPVIIIFTDGEPDDPRGLSQQDYFSEIEQLIDDNLPGVSLFLIAIDLTGAYWPDSSAFWKEVIPPDNIYELADMDDLQEKYNEIIRSLFGIPEIRREEVTPAGLEFDVLPYLEAMELHAFTPDTDLELILSGPDGKRLDFAGDGVIVRDLLGGKIIWINRPLPGKWHCEIAQGRGRMTVFRNSIPADVKLHYPDTHCPLGQEAELVVSFRYQDGTPVTSLPKYPLAMGMELIGPDGSRQNSSMIPEHNGVYHSADTLRLTTPGIYELALIVRGGDKFAYHRSFTFETVDLPYLVIDEPRRGSTVPLQNSIPVQVRCFYHGEQINPADLMVWTPDSTVLGQLIDPTGDQKENNPVWLNWQQGGYWEGRLPYEGKGGGQYLLVRMIGAMLGGAGEITGDTMVAFTVALTLVSKIKSCLIIAALILAAAIAIAAIAFSIWKSRLPLMHGELGLTPQQGRDLRVGLTRKKLVIQHLASKGAASGGWLMIYSPRGRREYVILRWSKQLFLQPQQLRSRDQRELGSWTVELR